MTFLKTWPIAAVVCFCLNWCGTVDVVAGEVQLAILSPDNWDEFAPGGKEVDAIAGDVVLRNEQICVVIAQPLASRHANLTIRNIAGCLIDATGRVNSSDQLGAYYPGGPGYVFREWKFLQSQDRPLQLTAGVHSGFSAVAVQVIAAASDGRPGLVVTYRLAADSPFLEIEQTYSNPHAAPLTFTPEDAVRLDFGKEDALKASNGTHALFWGEDRFWRQAYGWSAESQQITSRSDARNSVLKYAPVPTANAAEPPAAEITLQPGETHTLRIRLDMAENLCQLRSQQVSLREAIPAQTTLELRHQNGVLPGARVEFSRENSYYGTCWADGSGRIDQTLLPDTYRASVTFQGVPILENISLQIEPQLNVFQLNAKFETGLLRVKITDDQQQPLPCKLQLQRLDSDLPLDFGPESAVVGVKNVRYLVDGRDEVLLPAGEYAAIVSRGPEYDAAFPRFRVHAGEPAQLALQLPRVMHTPGWVSAEFHSHSSPSGDNTSSQLGRVLNLVCEHLEFAPCTEHNRIDTYEPHIQSLGIAHKLASCIGLELTGRPLPLNHQNIFPVIPRPFTQDGGAPQTDSSPEVQIQRAALWDDRSDKLVQQNHPDIGWLFFDKAGDGMPDGGFSQSFPYIDAIEVHPLVAILRYNPEQPGARNPGHNRLFHWLQLLNQGYRYTGVVNTDAHYNFHGSGGFRNWVRSSTDLPGEIDPLEMVHHTRGGHVIMSNGPFLSVNLTTPDDPNKTYGPGDEVTVPSKKVRLSLQVQCPNWFDIDRVYVLLNGRTQPEQHFRRATHADLFTRQTVRFAHELEIDLDRDAHLIVVAVGENSQLGPVMGPTNAKHQPIAISNPIFLDLSGTGFQPNQDLLEHPLPVKAP